MLIFYLAVLIIGMYWASKNLLPELLNFKPSGLPSPKALTISKPIENNGPGEPQKRIEKLEILLLEKNKNILFFQNELRILYAQVREFDKLKGVLDEEILRLREQNRIFRSELGLPTVQAKEGIVI